MDGFAGSEHFNFIDKKCLSIDIGDCFRVATNQEADNAAAMAVVNLLSKRNREFLESWKKGLDRLDNSENGLICILCEKQK